MDKKFCGIITGWRQEGEVIRGTCETHLDEDRTGIQQGDYMHTSAVEKITDFGTFKLCETRNSFYVLI